MRQFLRHHDFCETGKMRHFNDLNQGGLKAIMESLNKVNVKIH